MSRRPTVPVEALLAAIPDWPDMAPIAVCAERAGVSYALLWSRLVKLTYEYDLLIVEDDRERIAKIERRQLLHA